MSTNKSTILFDVDGTLFDSIPTILESFQETFFELNETYPGNKKIKSKIGSNLYNILGDYVSPKKLENATEIYRNIYLTKQDSGIISLFPDVIEVLEYLKQTNYILGIVTSKMRKHTVELLQQKNVQNYFQIVIGSEDVEKHKPHPDPLFKAVNDLKGNIDETIYIGDALIDFQAAKNAKMDFVAVTTGTTTKKDFQKNEQKVVLPDLLSLKEFF